MSQLLLVVLHGMELSEKNEMVTLFVLDNFAYTIGCNILYLLILKFVSLTVNVVILTGILNID